MGHPHWPAAGHNSTGAPGQRQAGQQLFDAYIAAKRAAHSKTRGSWIADYEVTWDACLRGTFGGRIITEVTPEDIDAFMASKAFTHRHPTGALDGPAKARTKQKRLRMLDAIFAHAVENRWLAHSPLLPSRHRITVLRQGVTSGKIVGGRAGGAGHHPCGGGRRLPVARGARR